MAWNPLLNKKPVEQKVVHHFIVAPPPPVVNSGLGEVNNPQVRWPTKSLGVMHPFDAKLTEAAVNKYGLVGGIVDKYVDYICGNGFHLKFGEKGGQVDKAQKILDSFNQQVKMSVLLRRYIKEALHKPGAYFEIETTKGKISGLKLLDGKSMYVQRDDHGKILGYAQYVGSFDKGQFNKQKIIPFKPEQIVALHYNVPGDCAYGLGVVYPNLDTINALMGLEQDMNTIVHRKANSPIHAKIGDPADPASMPTAEAVAGITNQLYTLTAKTEFATDGYWDIKVIDFGSMGEKFTAPIEHYWYKLIAGFQVPEVLLGKGNIAEGLGNVQTEGWERVISTKREVAEVVLVELYHRVLLENGIDLWPDIVWGMPTNLEIDSQVNQIISLMSVVQPELRFELEKKLAKLMDIDEEVLENPEEMRKRMLEEPLPGVPGENNRKAKPPAMQQTVRASLDDKAGFTVKEWLGFDYDKFKAFILQAISNNPFDELAAITEIELRAGYLSDSQVSGLRDILSDAFEHGKSIGDIEREISECLQIRDLYEVKEGEITTRLLSSAPTRAMSIARTETTRMANLGSQSYYAQNQVVEYRWVAAISDRTCPACENMNGRTFSINSRELPPLHTNCRCSIIPVTKI